ncbi:phenylalanine--tRNA ligase subunit alpha [Candidatus Woesearchaeota archaeon]|nr:phenylalanine--tRNA ligase subunit alpha [Candidatus Woesearchaeota archaeon]
MDKKLAAGLHPLERAVLPHLKQAGTLSELAKASGLQEVEAMRALQWLEGKGLLKIETKEQEVLHIKEKGQAAAKEGLPERHVIAVLKKKGELPVAEIAKALPAYDKGAVGAVTGKLKKLGIPFITTKDGKPAFKWIEIPIKENPVRPLLDAAAKNKWTLVLTKDQVDAAQDLLKRQGYAELQKQKGKEYNLTADGKGLTKLKLKDDYEERLTSGMLKTGGWKGKEFRPYNVEINVPRKAGGRAHFVNDAIAYIKRIWLELGFEEMTGNHVQTAFWDLDALFVPQDHPAREMQDTFYIEQPSSGLLPADMWKKVKAVHENGGDTGSTGWRYTYSEDEAKKNLLRTHTTVLSAQSLNKIRKGLKKMPGKFFSVNTVYRNEALDWSHLFEFYQVEGIVVDENANLQNLKGYLREFFGKMGFPDVRIRPAHFPYTEPSAEVDVWDSKKKTWVELGGCGIFRPEVTKTLIGKEVPVLAWGLGMERIIKEYYGFEDIRDLYRNDLEQLKNVKAWLK